MAGFGRCPFCMEGLPDGQLVCPHCGCDTFKPHSWSFSANLPPLAMLANRYVVGMWTGYCGSLSNRYIGYDLKLNRKVTVKEFFPRSCSTRRRDYTVEAGNGKDGEYMKRLASFLEEAEILIKFTYNPNIIRIFDCFLQYGTAYIVTEHLEGQSLEFFIPHKGKCSFEKALALLRPIALVLGHMHSAGYYHGYVRPNSIMLLPNGRTKLFDFGSVFGLPPPLGPGYFSEEYDGPMYSFPYAAPECFTFDNTPKPDARSDIYGFCAMLYLFITGFQPPDCFVRARYPESALISPRDKDADISPRQERALLKGMSLAPEDRPGSMQELLDSFDDIPPHILLP